MLFFRSIGAPTANVVTRYICHGAVACRKPGTGTLLICTVHPTKRKLPVRTKIRETLPELLKSGMTSYRVCEGNNTSGDESTFHFESEKWKTRV
jgi:hypothetical protein